MTVLEGSKNVVITDVTTKEANDYDANFGMLVRVEGTVQSVKLAGGIVESIALVDESGESCRVFVDGYIDYSNDASQPLEDFVKEELPSPPLALSPTTPKATASGSVTARDPAGGSGSAGNHHHYPRHRILHPGAGGRERTSPPP